MRCLVTGASGFIGRHLVPKLLSRGHELTVLLRDPSKLAQDERAGAIRVVPGDFTSLGGLQDELALNPVDVTIHLAWEGVMGEDRNRTQQITGNVRGTLALWETASQAGCQAWIGLGSQAEYGPTFGSISEECPTKPVTAYGAAKLATGILTRRLCQLNAMRFVWLRLFSGYGPGDDPRHMIPALITALFNGQEPAVTACEQLWDYLYIADIVDAIIACVERDIEGTFNLGGGSAVPLRWVVESVRDCIDRELPIGFGAVPYRPDQVMHLESDITRLASAVGWRPQIDLQEGLRQTVDYYRRKELKR
jgi:nucleoside-diphosphate-sugar epimerase